MLELELNISKRLCGIARAVGSLKAGIWNEDESGSGRGAAIICATLRSVGSTRTFVLI